MARSFLAVGALAVICLAVGAVLLATRPPDRAPPGPHPRAAPAPADTAPPAPPGTPPPADPLLAAVADPEAPGHETALAEWEALPDEERCTRLRGALRFPGTTEGLYAAKVLRPESLSLAEIRAQMDILVGRAEEVFSWAGAPGSTDWVDGLDSTGSPDAVRIYRRASLAASAARSALPPPPEQLHRPTLQGDIAALADLLGPASGPAWESILWNLHLLADNSDRDREVMARALLYERACILASLEGEDPPAWEGFPAPEMGPGIPGAFRTIARAAWGLEEGEELLRHFRAPGAWLGRWAQTVRPGPSDVPFLREVALDIPDDGLHGGWRSWATRALDRIGSSEARAALAAVAGEGWDLEKLLAAEEAEAPEPEAYTAAQARARAAAWAALPEEEVSLDWSPPPDLCRIEVAAPGALDGLLRRWCSARDPDLRGWALDYRVRLGDPEAALETLRGLYPRDLPLHLGRVRTPEVRRGLEGILAEGCAEPGAAIRGLAVWHGLPEHAASALDPGNEAGWKDPAWAAAAAAVRVGDPAGALLGLAEAGATGGERTACLGLIGPRAIPALRRIRDARSRGLYWPATAGLAIAGDAAARTDFLGLLGDDRTFLYDRSFDEIGFTLNGDPEALAHWRSRVGSNCCLWNYAAAALRRWYPTMPAEQRVGDFDGEAARAAAWWEKWKDRLRWSRLADGWVPVADD